MEPKEKILNQFAELVEKDKFSTEEWNKRGLNPSDENVIAYMNSRLEIVMAELILAVDKNSSKRTLKKILKKGLARYRRIDLDTEEAEFIVDYFELFAHILEIRFGDNLMRWLYGFFVYWLMKITRFLKPERILSTKKQPCTKCGTDLEIQLIKIGSGRTGAWVIGKCLTCNEYNIMESFNDAKNQTFINFSYEESLSKEEYDEEQANIRLEQIKYWRK